MQVTLILKILVFTLTLSQKTFNPLEKLIGKWEGKVMGNEYSETWVSSGGNYSGYSSTLKEGKEISRESMNIITNRGKIIFRVSLNDEVATEFSLEKMRNDTLLFSNLNHDFPKHILYTFKGDSMIASITDEPFGKNSLVFRLRKQ